MLLQALLTETRIPWIRTLYWYPAFIDDALLELMAKEPRLCKYIDMPIQHASDSQLKLMKRHYKKDDLQKLLLKIREKIPTVTLRTTVLVGFPGETHEDFEELMNLIQEVRFEHLGGFVYSPEEGTPAEKLTETLVTEEEARARLEAVTDLQESISLENNETLIGKEVHVLIDEVDEAGEYHFLGRTEGNALDTDDIVKIIDGDGEPGKFYKALVMDANPHELICKIVNPCEPTRS
jgi:ribosomal protein S12 methylthiotransferase